MKTMTGIVLTGLALAFAGCNSETGHNQANDNAVKSHGAPERTPAGVDNAKPAAVVNQAAQQAQGAIVTAQYTADKAAADANNLKNEAAGSTQNLINNANRDVRGLENALR